MSVQQRVQFDTNVDELADATCRHWLRTAAGQAQRRRGILGTAVAFAASFVIATLTVSGASRESVLPIAVLAAILAGLAWPLHRTLHDRAFRRRVRRAVVANLGAAATWTCEVELRTDGLWSRGRDTEILFGWKDLQAIEDADDAVELHFSGGIVVVRDRAFTGTDERQRFARAARELADGPTVELAHP